MQHQTTKLKKWILKTQRKKNNLLTYQQSFISNKYFSYFIFRIRYFLITNFLNLFLHIFEFYLLSILFSFKHLKLFMIVRILTLIFKPIWWGILELMREKIRFYFKQKDFSLLAKELGNWYILSFIISHIFIIISIYFISNSFFHTKVQKFSDLYIAAVCLELSFSLFIDTYRAGIYAIYRISINIKSLIIPSILCMAIVFSLFKIFDQYIILINILLTGSISSLISFYYIKKTHTFYNWPKAIFPNFILFKNFILSLFCMDFFITATANFFMNIEILLPFIILIKLKDYFIEQQLFFILYLLIPIIRMSTSWAKLFYFDLIRYKNHILYSFMQKFQKKFLTISAIFGLFLGITTNFILYIYTKKFIFIISIFLIFYFVVRSIISYLQIVAFCQKRYLDVIISGILIILCYGTLNKDLNLNQTITLISIFLISSFFYILFQRIPVLINHKINFNSMSFIQWFEKLIEYDKETIILRIKFFNKIKFKQINYLINEISMNQNIFCLDEHHYYLFGNFNIKELIYKLNSTSGLIEDFQFSPIQENGIDAFLHAKLIMFFYPNFLKKYYNLNEELNSYNLTVNFKKEFPNGEFGFFNDKNILNYKNLRNKKQSIIFQKNFQHFLQFPGSQKTIGNYTISIAFTEKNNPIFFIIPVSNENLTDIFRWKMKIYQFNLNQLSSINSFILT